MVDFCNFHEILEIFTKFRQHNFYTFLLQRSPAGEHVLLRSQINYHNFTITQEHLQQAIQVTVVFSPPPRKAFPIMLLFR